MAENEPEAVEDFYYEVCMLATARNRRGIAKPAPMERIENDLCEQKEEAQREAEKSRKNDGGDESSELAYA